MPINPLAPMLMFAILFGLSMDYEVFLLSRVREEYRITRDPRGSLVTGVRATAPVITSAALIMICVFYAFVLSHDITSKLFGVGLGTAVLLDVTLVRMVLVPAAMSLLGTSRLAPAAMARPDPSGHRSGRPPFPGRRGRRPGPDPCDDRRGAGPMSIATKPETAVGCRAVVCARPAGPPWVVTATMIALGCLAFRAVDDAFLQAEAAPGDNLLSGLVPVHPLPPGGSLSCAGLTEPPEPS